MSGGLLLTLGFPMAVQGSSAIICGRRTRRCLYCNLASCPVPSCGKRDGGNSKGLQVGPLYPTPYFPGASDSVSSHIFKVLLNLKYAIVMALFLTTELVAGAFRNVFLNKNQLSLIYTIPIFNIRHDILTVSKINCWNVYFSFKRDDGFCR